MWKPLCVAALASFVFAPAIARADNTTDGGFEFTLSGVGNSNQDVDAGSAAVEAGAAIFIGPVWSIGARQSVGYSDFNNGTAVNASSRAFTDFQLNLGRFAPFAGANVGYIYGEGVNDTFAAGPEAGVKVYFGETNDVFLYGRVEYQFYFDKGDAIDDVFEDGQFNYSIGIGMRF